MSTTLFLWWLALCAVSALNVFAWSLSGAALARRWGMITTGLYTVRGLQLLLSGGYVFGCAFRAVLPRFDVQRVCLFDTWLSSIVVGRSVATVAELCFAVQWVLILKHLDRDSGDKLGAAVARLVIPMIALAEVCSWYSVLTTSNLGHVFEESLWGLSAALLALGLARAWPRCESALRPYLAAWCAAAIASVGYRFRVDVPMYWSRWLADEASARQYLTLADGALDVSSRWIVATQWEEWREEALWMSLYFSVGVWVSISFMHAHTLQEPAGRFGRVPRAARVAA